jgi:hypothetical protein
MRLVLLTGLALLALATAAEAKCQTSAMAGTWQTLIIQPGPTQTSAFCTMIVTSAGGITGDCSSGPGTASLSAKCAVTITFSSVVFKGRTEAIGTGSTLKPNQVQAKSNTGLYMAAFRK